MTIISKKGPPKILKKAVIVFVKKIPFGSVVTYGVIANELGLIARTVGWIMASLSEEDMITVPWQRVVGAGGTVPALKYGLRGNEQIRRLEEEGLIWNKNKFIIGKNQWFVSTKNNFIG